MTAEETAQIETLVCQDCGELFERELKRGRKPKRCDTCNKDAILERKREYREANKDAILERKREYREANKDAILEYQREKQQVMNLLNQAPISVRRAAARLNVEGMSYYEAAKTVLEKHGLLDKEATEAEA